VPTGWELVLELHLQGSWGQQIFTSIKYYSLSFLKGKFSKDAFLFFYVFPTSAEVIYVLRGDVWEGCGDRGNGQKPLPNCVLI
jgi:hypothetical protein